MLYGPTYALYAFFASLRHVSRSGEVWVEAARLYLSPLSPFFSLSMAQKCLNYAMHFTPQYGDVYIKVCAFENYEFCRSIACIY